MNQLEYIYQEYSYVLVGVVLFAMLMNVFSQKRKKNKKQKGGGLGGCLQAILSKICYMLSFGTLCKNHASIWSIDCKGGW
uniref:Uncharacterized protein n=1 Tax=viral metagenome TaxID=1070528 RepID=A0A6C0JFA2_9ZZZZ